MRILGLISATLLLAACSGSGGATADPSSSSSSTSTQLWIDSGVGEQARISGVLQTVALERPDGSFTPDLLATDASLVIADPEGTTHGLPLDPPPPGVFVAAHLMFVPGTLRIELDGRGSVALRIPDPQLRAPFRRPVTIDSDRTWFVVRHGGPLVLGPEAGGGGMSWTPELEADLRDLQLIENQLVRIVATDLEDLSATAEIPDGEDSVVRLLFRSATDLTLGHEEEEGEEYEEREGEEEGEERMVTPREFVAALEAGDEVLLRTALFEEPDRVWVLAATSGDDEESENERGRGNKSDVGGVIAELFPRQNAFDLDVQSVKKAGFGFPQETPLRLRVIVDGDTRIKWVPRQGRHRGHLGFAALEEGMRIEVEWHDAPRNRTVTADKIDIRCRQPIGGTASLSGVVRRSDPSGGKIVVEATDGGAVWREFTSVILEIDAETILLRHVGRELNAITLDELQLGDRVWTLAEPRRDNVLRAKLVLAEGR